MRDTDKRAFAELLNGVAAYYDRKLSPQTLAIYWQGLADLELEQVRSALNAHAQDSKAGQFMPKIADIRRALEATQDDGHPSADEAWAVALPARHESASVVWTEQISSAFFTAALPLLDEGDKVAARRAFIDRYEREVADARKYGIPAIWTASIGTDPRLRAEAVEQAALAGRLTSTQAAAMLPFRQSEPDAVLRLESGVAEHATTPEDARAQLAALRSLLRIVP